MYSSSASCKYSARISTERRSSFPSFPCRKDKGSCNIISSAEPCMDFDVGSGANAKTTRARPSPMSHNCVDKIVDAMPPATAKPSHVRKEKLANCRMVFPTMSGSQGFGNSNRKTASGACHHANTAFSKFLWGTRRRKQV
eukprot:3081938-Amphidinium_carterae.1